MASQILTDLQQAVLADERRLLGDARALMARVGAPEPDQLALAEAIGQLDDFFLLVVVGEFNSGKSAFINEFLGLPVLAEGVTPTTERISVLRHGDAVASVQRADGTLEITAPAPILRDIHVVDTPGTNAILRDHEALTTKFVPRSDLVIFVTSADRPFTETERAFLETIRDWGKRVVVAVNKIDILESTGEVDQVVRFLEEGVRTLLGMSPRVFPVSVRLARRGREGDQAALTASRFEALDGHIRATLESPDRVRLKFLNPIGVADRVMVSLLEESGARLAVLDDDLGTLADIDRQTATYARDMARDFEFRMADVEKLLIEMEQRGHAFFEETLRIGRVMDLVKKTRIEQAYADQVVADTPRRIERKVSEIVDWLVDTEFLHWQSVSATVARRQQARGDRIGGSPEAGRFLAERTRLVESLVRESQQTVETFDRQREAGLMAEKARGAVAASAAAGLGAVGLGAVVTAAATTVAADVTGLAAAGLLAAVGLFVIPDRRRRAKRDLREKITTLRATLARTLRSEFESEMSRSVERVRESIAPYSRFVRSEHEHLTRARADVTSLRAELDNLRGRILA